MRRIVLATVLAFFGAPASTEEAHPQFAAGLEAYEFFCSKCHGKDMVNPGTSSYDLRKFPQDEKDRFYDVVKNGKDDMPAWGDVIYPEELDALWVYVATRGGNEPFPAAEETQSSIPPVDPKTLVAEGFLTACLPRNAGALSGMRHDGGEGLDFRVGAALADLLGLTFQAVWFESEQEEESDPVRETYALLAHGLCDIVPGLPLYESAVGTPHSPRGALPRWRDMPLNWDPHKQIDLAPVAVSNAYMRAEIGLVYRDGTPEPRNLDDLIGRRVALQQETLSGAIVLAHAGRRLAGDAITLNPGAAFLWEIEKGVAEVAIIDVAAYDAHLKHNPVSPLKLATWRHDIGFDIGFAMLETQTDLRDALNSAIQTLRTSGQVATIAAEEGAHFAAPHSDEIKPRFSLARLMAGSRQLP